MPTTDRRTAPPPPTMADALVTGGALCHFVLSDPVIAERFVRWAEHCPGDLDVELVADYLGRVHDLLSPECATPAAADIRAELADARARDAALDGADD